MVKILIVDDSQMVRKFYTYPGNLVHCVKKLLKGTVEKGE